MALFGYKYAISEFSGSPSGKELHREVADSSIAKPFSGVTISYGVGDDCTFGFDEALTKADETILDAIVAAHDSEVAVKKSERFQDIDATTNVLFSIGFEYPPASGNMFSLSLAGQSKLHGLYALRKNVNLVYPIKCNTVSDDAEYELVDVASLEAFYLAAFGAARSLVDAGTVLKSEIRDATTVEEVDAVKDERLDPSLVIKVG